jgi:hypothetical protein
MFRKRFEMLRPMALGFLIVLTGATAVLSQTPSYPDKIRGYKVERTVVEIKKPETKNGAAQTDVGTNSDSDVDTLIQFGNPELARVTPLGITFEVPIVVAPVKQSGHVDFLMFEDMVVNGTPVEIAEYRHTFDLPNKQPLQLKNPLRFYIYLTRAVLAALGEWTDSKETWQVTGRVYVFGKFKKSLFSFKRCIPIELDVPMRNPLQSR